MTYNDIVEYYDYVCNSVQTLEGGYLYLHRTLKNGIEKSLIEGALQGTTRSSLSIRELSGLALVNPRKSQWSLHHSSIPLSCSDICGSIPWFEFGPYPHGASGSSVGRQPRLSYSNVWSFDSRNVWSKILPTMKGFKSLCKSLKQNRLTTLKVVRVSKQQQQQRRRQIPKPGTTPWDSVPLLIDSPDDVKEPASKRAKTSCWVSRCVAVPIFYHVTSCLYRVRLVDLHNK